MTVPLRPHPLAERYPLMEGEEYAAFKADIAANGLSNPVVLYEGKILDGRNRHRACRELGIEPTYGEFEGTAEQAAAFVDSQNLHRRHLTTEWRRKRVAELRAQGMSTREIAKEVKASQMTVVRDLQGAGESDDSPAPQQSPAGPPRVKGKDGKQYPARKRRGCPRKAAAEPAAWDELVRKLSDVASTIEAIGAIPEESKPWDLVKQLERTGRSLLARAAGLRKRHHL